MILTLLAATSAATIVPKATPIDMASWFSVDDYPPEAQKKNIQGNTTFEVDVDSQGKPTACRVTKSSGSALLDETTCDVVRARAKFKPAIRRGKAVAGRYSNVAKWQLEGSAGSQNLYFANVLDFSADADHPTCTVILNGISGVGAGCAEAVRKYGAFGARVKKLVVFTSITTGDKQPYAPESGWGRRVAFVAIDLYSPKQGGKAACAVVKQDGSPPDISPCAPYNDADQMTDQEKSDAIKSHVEQSLFEVRRRSTSEEKCKNGESAAEVNRCV